VTPEVQRTTGETTYQIYCASCHDTEQGIGPRLTRELLATRGTAGKLFIYNRDKMPYNAGNLLTEEEYWNITAYMLARTNLVDSDIVLNPDNAEYIFLSPNR